jgi:hypothetical protein
MSLILNCWRKMERFFKSPMLIKAFSLKRFIHFSQADLTPLFNWNVKQLFLYLTAEYSTPNNEVNGSS